jgi:hypothetical protein
MTMFGSTSSTARRSAGIIRCGLDTRATTVIDGQTSTV